MKSFRTGVIALLLLPLFSVPSWAQPKTEPAPKRPLIGIFYGPAEKGGIVVRGVTPDGPAAKAGLKNGDRIMKIGDQEVKDADKFQAAINAKKPGDKVTLAIQRDGKDQNLEVTLGSRPEAPRLGPTPTPPRPLAFLGVQTIPVTPELKKARKIEADAGVLVTDVIPNSPAAKADLKRDDVITAVNDTAIKDPGNLREAVQKAGAGKEVNLQVMRGKEKLSIKATLREGPISFMRTPGDRFPGFDVDPARRIREMERRIEELEKLLREKEKKVSA